MKTHRCSTRQLPLFTQVSPPGLHITLLRLWTLLEEECHQLDLELAKHAAPESTDRNAFAEYSNLVKELTQQEDRRNVLRQHTSALQQSIANLVVQLPNAQANPVVQGLFQETVAAKRQLKDVVSFTD